MRYLLFIFILFPFLCLGESSNVKGWDVSKETDNFTDEVIYKISKKSSNNEELVFFLEDGYQMRVSTSYFKGFPYINFNDHICENIDNSVIGEFRVDNEDAFNFNGMDVSADNSSVFIPTAQINGHLLLKQILTGEKLIVRITDYICGQTFTTNFDLSGINEALESITKDFKSKQVYENKVDYYSQCIGVDIKSFKVKNTDIFEQINSKIKFTNNCSENINGGLGISNILDGYRYIGTSDFFSMKIGESKTLKFDYRLEYFLLGYDFEYDKPNQKYFNYIKDNFEYYLTVYEKDSDSVYPFYKIEN